MVERMPTKREASTTAAVNARIALDDPKIQSGASQRMGANESGRFSPIETTASDDCQVIYTSLPLPMPLGFFVAVYNYIL
jgi:hypothetical protein